MIAESIVVYRSILEQRQDEALAKLAESIPTPIALALLLIVGFMVARQIFFK